MKIKAQVRSSKNSSVLIGIHVNDDRKVIVPTKRHSQAKRREIGLTIRRVQITEIGNSILNSLSWASRNCK
jgi:hypothetical protein